MSKFIVSTNCSLILVVLLFTILIPGELVDGKTNSKPVNKVIMKTIKVDEDEIIDCYDIYKQPSFNHPSLHNHQIQV
ncbi:hypothetical protein MKW92_037330 [Papaver armeniacum]|nr:hypothetical protein MKW92_037330 [Papaver armeniacum]